MRAIFYVFSLIVVLGTAACGPVYETSYRFTPPPTVEGRACANQCLERKNTCMARCVSSEQSCREVQRLHAENAYLKYERERKAQGQPVKKTQDEFLNYGMCLNQDCTEQCKESHRICHSNCGGNVIEDRRCTAFCE